MFFALRPRRDCLFVVFAPATSYSVKEHIQQQFEKSELFDLSGHMSRLRVRLLGGLAVFARAGRPVPIARSCRSVLGYLIAHRHRCISRVELAETLWPEHDGDRARRCLSTALWRLKKASDSGPPLLAFQGVDQVSFNWGVPLWVDSIALELRVRPLLHLKPDTLRLEAIKRLERGVRLYKGDYLIGVDDEWACLERQRLRNLYFDGLYQLISAYAAMSNWGPVLQWGRRLNQEEPLREDVHRMLMRAYLFTGNRAKAMVQYQQCLNILHGELGVEPMPETQTLYAEFLCSSASSAAPEPLEVATIPAYVDRSIERLRRDLESSRRQLDQAIETLRQAGVSHIHD
jgi:DNA-binding SARP family transcriptional activator